MTTNATDQAALVRACASFVRDTYSGEWADDAAATLETDADRIESGEQCSLLRLAATMRPAASSAVVARPTDQTEEILRVVENALGDTLVSSARAEALEGIPAVLTAGTPTGHSARDRIASALYERERPPGDPAWEHAYPADREVFEAMADAVLPVLPPVDRAAVLRWAADRYERS